jgi:hypothetical protein
VQDLPPSVRLPGHYAKAGLLLEWQKRSDGEWWALVEYAEDVPGYRGGLEPRQAWFRADQVERVDGENYGTVPRTRAE